jgi:hypothetical protein
MFDELDKKDVVSGGGVKPTGAMPIKAEDIFSEVDKSTKPEAFRPRDNSSLYPPETVIPAEDGWLKNKGIIFGLIIGAIVIICGGFIILKLMIKNTAPANTQIKEEVKNTQVTPEVTAPVVEEVNNTVTQPIQPTLTAPIDTDQDGLTDREEIKVYGTEPLESDTDSDGYIDGEEVKGGFNPKGPGKLLDINNQKQ